MLLISGDHTISGQDSPVCAKGPRSWAAPRNGIEDVSMAPLKGSMGAGVPFGEPADAVSAGVGRSEEALCCD
jgi:hypothetical protein